MLRLNNLSSPSGANRKNKRIGRGQGSGWGTQAGKGHKGQKARTGGGIPLAFEGGQMPVYRRLPKRGFSNAPFKKSYSSISIEKIVSLIPEGEVSREVLINHGLLSGNDKRLPIKILKRYQDTKLTIKYKFLGINSFSAKARELIESSGSQIVTE
jgi:large subunit ribosomal protein L15